MGSEVGGRGGGFMKLMKLKIKGKKLRCLLRRKKKIVIFLFMM